MIDRMNVPAGAGDLQTLARHANMTAVIVSNASWPRGMLIDHEHSFGSFQDEIGILDLHCTLGIPER